METEVERKGSNLTHFIGEQNDQKVEMVPRAGIEPATRGFSIRCSTN
jgi:hypothetical protein